MKRTNKTNEPPLTWHPLPGETKHSYESFLIYRDLGPFRTLSKAHAARKGTETAPKQHQNGTEKVPVPGYFKKWSSQFRWRERAELWDKDRRDIHEKHIEDLRIKSSRYRFERGFETQELFANLVTKLAAHISALMTPAEPEKPAAINSIEAMRLFRELREFEAAFRSCFPDRRNWY